MPEPKTLPVSFRFSPEVKGALETAALADGRSMSNLVERVLTEWLSSKGFLGQSTVPLMPEQRQTVGRRARKAMER